jgi:hypothetical protein
MDREQHAIIFTLKLGTDKGEEKKQSAGGKV